MSEEEIKILVVEDEESIRKFIKINLIKSGYKVYEAESGETALKMIKESEPAAVILDIMLPGIDGFEVCRRIRSLKLDTIIIMLTARGQDTDKITGLEIGADDYMVKPFNPLELVARLRNILRRTRGSGRYANNSISYKNLLLDMDSQKFMKDNVEIELTPTEFTMLKTFMKNAGRALNRNELFDLIWGKNYFGDMKTLDVYIRRLREKIEDNPSKPKFIETVWGFGYRWAKE
jgi:DNA-binding response OmpR family regulator